MPRPVPAASGAPHPASFATVSSTLRWRGLPASNCRRSSNGSYFWKCAISSMKLSSKNAECEWPTERQKPTGTTPSAKTASSR